MNKKNKQVLLGVVGAVVVAGAGFWGGTVYAKAGVPARGGQFAAGQFMGRTGTGGMGAVLGQIIAADQGSITVKLQSGSTQIVLLGTSTPILKTSQGSASDLSVGTNVAVAGKPNSDGSVTAQSVQVRPAGMASFGGGAYRTQGQ